MASTNDGYLLVGFLCPICKANLTSAELLLAHYTTHEDDFEPVTLRKFDVRSSMSKIFDKVIDLQTTSFNRVFGGTSEYRPVTINEASTNKPNVGSSMKKKIDKSVELGTTTRDRGFEGSSKAKRAVTVSEAELRTKDLLEVFTGKTDKEKVKLTSRSHTDELVKLRSEKIKNQGTETYRILERIRKYLNNEKPDKSIWKKVKDEVDSAMESYDCTGCKKQFKLTRRKHHCKLCETALCDNCSQYVAADIAGLLLNEPQVPTKSLKPLRHCKDCELLLKVIKARSGADSLDSKLTETYKEMQNLKRQISQTVVTYKEIYESIVKGKAIHDPSQAIIVRDHIGKRGREIALLGKLIVELPAQAETRQAQLQATIMKATDSFVEELLTLPKVPTPEAIEEARLRRLSNSSVRSRRESGLVWEEL